MYLRRCPHISTQSIIEDLERYLKTKLLTDIDMNLMLQLQDRWHLLRKYQDCTNYTLRTSSCEHSINPVPTQLHPGLSRCKIKQGQSDIGCTHSAPSRSLPSDTSGYHNDGRLRPHDRRPPTPMLNELQAPHEHINNCTHQHMHPATHTRTHNPCNQR